MNINHKTILMAAYFMCIDSGETFDDTWEETLVTSGELVPFADYQISDRFMEGLFEELKNDGYLAFADDLWPYIEKGYYLTDLAYEFCVNEDEDTWYTRLYESIREEEDWS